MFFYADAFYLPAAQVKRPSFLLQTVKSDLKEDLGNISLHYPPTSKGNVSLVHNSYNKPKSLSELFSISGSLFIIILKNYFP